MIVDLRVVFLIRLSTDLNFSKRVAFRVFFMSPLSDHFTLCQLGEDDSVWEAAFCHSATAVVLDVLQEQDLSAGAVCLLKYAGICPAALPANVKASHCWWNPSNGAQNHDSMSTYGTFE